MVKLRDPLKSDTIAHLSIVAIFIAGIAAILYMSYPDNILVGIILIFGCRLVMVRWHTRTFGYLCANCEEGFEAPFWKDFIIPQGLNRKGGWKYLKCPNCGQRTTAREMVKVR